MSRFARIVVLACAVAVAGVAAHGLGRWLAPQPELSGTVLDEPRPVGALELTAAGGERVALAEVAGEWTLVFFGFVDCPDVCPLTMARLAEIYENLGEPEELRVVMITVDPERDDPERLERFVDGFHPDFVGLGGSPQDVGEAASSFFVGYNDAGGTLVHTDAVAVLDADARLRMVYAQDDMRGLAGDAAQLLDGRSL